VQPQCQAWRRHDLQAEPMRPPGQRPVLLLSALVSLLDELQQAQ
jgi:hypothetical protein